LNEWRTIVKFFFIFTKNICYFNCSSSPSSFSQPVGLFLVTWANLLWLTHLILDLITLIIFTDNKAFIVKFSVSSFYSLLRTSNVLFSTSSHTTSIFVSALGWKTKSEATQYIKHCMSVYFRCEHTCRMSRVTQLPASSYAVLNPRPCLDQQVRLLHKHLHHLAGS